MIEEDEFKKLADEIKERFAASERSYLQYYTEYNKVSFHELQEMRDILNEEKKYFNSLVDKLYHKDMLQLKIDINENFMRGDWVYLDTDPSNPNAGIWDASRTYYINLDTDIPPLETFNLN